MAEALRTIAQIHELQGRGYLARLALEKCLEMSAALCSEDKQNLNLIQDVGKCLQKLRRFKEALFWFLKGLLLASLPAKR